MDHPSPGARADLAAASVCMAFGVLMAMLPHGLWWLGSGSPAWIADYDEVLYLQVASQAYAHHPTHLGDPTVAAPGSGSAYSAATLVPAILAARALGLGPSGISYALRLGSGLGCGLLTFLLLRHGLGRPVAAMVLACLFLADVGFLSGHLVVRTWLVAARVAAGRPGALLAANPKILPQWRIINPAPSLAFLMLHVLLVLRARDRPTRARVALAGAGLGLLFYVYFYYYTAACLAMALALALDAGARRVHAQTLAIGALIGLPGVVHSYLFQRATSPDWLQRSDKFVPIPHLSELMIPRVAPVLLAAGLAWVVLRRRDLLYVALVALSGLILNNHQVVTGLQIDNFHWFYAWGPMTSVLAAIVAVDACRAWSRGRIAGRRWRLGLILASWMLQLGLGVWLRAVESTRSRENLALMADFRRYQADRLDAGAPRLPADAVMAGDPRFVDFAAIFEDQRPLSGFAARLSPYVDDASWNERIALNALLLGRDEAGFEADQRKAIDDDLVGPWVREPIGRAALLAERMACFRALRGDGRAALRRYGVRTLALPAGREPPGAWRAGWARIRTGRWWDVYKIDDR